MFYPFVRAISQQLANLTSLDLHEFPGSRTVILSTGLLSLNRGRISLGPQMPPMVARESNWNSRMEIGGS